MKEKKWKLFDLLYRTSSYHFVLSTFLKAWVAVGKKSFRLTRDCGYGPPAGLAYLGYELSQLLKSWQNALRLR
jgi:hypothetical protein